jgi:two-component system, OmpR family, phosphate regulon response regulator PhoB
METTRKVLVVEPDPVWRGRITEGLASPLIATRLAERAREALEAASADPPDLILTELFLPDLSGFALCRLVRENAELEDTGLLVVSAYASEADRILAFEVGADDFLAKPFYSRELASRAAAVLRRSGLARVDPRGETEGGSLVSVNPGTGSVRVGGHRLDLTPRELDLLLTLIRGGGRVLTRNQLITEVWGPESPQTDRVVDAHIKAIRRKLGPAKECLETVRGIGYRFSDPLRD